MRSQTLLVGLLCSLLAAPLWLQEDSPAAGAQSSDLDAVKGPNGGIRTARPAGASLSAADYPSIQAALDALPPTGGRVFIPAGTYLLTGSLKPRNNVTIAGAGPATVLKACDLVVAKTTSPINVGDTQVAVDNPAGFQVGMDVFAHNGYSGIAVTGGSGNILSGNVCFANSRAARGVHPGIKISIPYPDPKQADQPYLINAVVTGNSCDDVGDKATQKCGIEVATNVRGVIVRDNTSYGNLGAGILPDSSHRAISEFTPDATRSRCRKRSERLISATGCAILQVAKKQLPLRYHQDNPVL